MELVHEDSLNTYIAERRATESLGWLPADETLAYTCHQLVSSSSMMFAGRNDGIVASWKLGPSDAKDTLLGAHKGAVRCLTFDASFGPSGMVFTGGADRVLKLWDPFVRDVRQACVQTVVGHGGTINAVCTGTDVVVSCSNDNTIRVWQPDANRRILLYPWLIQVQVIQESSWVLSAVLRPTELFIGESSGTLSVYQMKERPQSTNKKLPKICKSFDVTRRYKKLHRLGITSILVVSEQNLMCTISYDCTLRVSEASSGAALLVIENPRRKRFTGLDWNAYNQELSLVDESGFVYLWNIYMDKCLKQLQVAHSAVNAITVSGKQQTFVMSAGDSVQRWKIVRELQFAKFTGHTEPVVGLVYLPSSSATADDARVFSASLDNHVCCWDPYDMNVIYKLTEKRSEISCMTHLANCGLLVTGNDDGSIRFWNPDAGSSQVYKHHKNTVSDMCLVNLKRCSYLISGSFDGHVGIWDVTKRRSVKPAMEYMFQANEDESEILTVAPFEPDDEKQKGFFTAGNDCNIKLWYMSNYTVVATLEGHTDSVTCLSIDANFLFSGSDDKSIRLWNLANPLEPYCLRVWDNAHKKSIRQLHLIPDLSYVLSCSFDGKIIVRDYKHFDEETATIGRTVTEFKHSQHIRCITFRPEKAHILAGTEEGSILLFPLSESDAAPKKQAAAEEKEEEEEEEQKRSESPQRTERSGFSATATPGKGRGGGAAGGAGAGAGAASKFAGAAFLKAAAKH